MAWDRESVELVLQSGVAALGVEDHADLPTVGDDHRDVALREGLVLLRLVTGLVGARVVGDQVAQHGQSVLRLLAGDCSLPLGTCLGGEGAAAYQYLPGK